MRNMLDQASPYYDTYRRVVGRVYRTNAEILVHDKNAQPSIMPPGSLVEVLCAEQTLTVIYGKIKVGATFCNGVIDDGVRLTIGFLNRGGRPDPRDLTYDGAFLEMLVREPGVPRWLPEWSAAAIGQGWDIFYCDGSEGPRYQLQAAYEAERFDEDSDAWEFVWNRAIEEECPVANAAMAFLYSRCPEEYREIRNRMAALQGKGEPIE